jgi:hypothetical protein
MLIYLKHVLSLVMMEILTQKEYTNKNKDEQRLSKLDNRKHCVTTSRGGER